MSIVTFQYIQTGYSRKMQTLIDMLNDPSVKTNINQTIGQALNQFVPMKSGALRQSMYADSEGIHWSTDYAHYQYAGIVYGPNLPGWMGNTAGWRSPSIKYPTGRELGAFRTLSLRPVWVLTGNGYRRANANDPTIHWTTGYTTPNTSHHWVRFYTANQWNLGGSGIKADTNKQITAYLKAECRRRGLRT